MLTESEILDWAVEDIDDLASHVAVVSGDRRIPVIFWARYVDALGVAATGPAMTFSTKDWPEPSRGDEVWIEQPGTAYTVTTVEPNDTGLTLVRMQKQ